MNDTTRRMTHAESELQGRVRATIDSLKNEVERLEMEAYVYVADRTALNGILDRIIEQATSLRRD